VVSTRSRLVSCRVGSLSSGRGCKEEEVRKGVSPRAWFVDDRRECQEEGVGGKDRRKS